MKIVKIFHESPSELDMWVKVRSLGINEQKNTLPSIDVHFVVTLVSGYLNGPGMKDEILPPPVSSFYCAPSKAQEHDSACVGKD